jgi:hypothetical protein
LIGGDRLADRKMSRRRLKNAKMFVEVDLSKDLLTKSQGHHPQNSRLDHRIPRWLPFGKSIGRLPDSEINP